MGRQGKIDEVTDFVSVEAEEATLGAMLYGDPDVLRIIERAGVTAAHYYRDSHRAIHRAIVEVVASGALPDPLTVFRRMCADGTQALVQTGAELARMAADVPTVENAEHYAKIVRDLAARREALSVLRAHAVALRSLDTPVDAIRDGVVAQWPTGPRPDAGRLVDEVFAERVAALERAHEAPPRVPSSFPTVNQWWGGYGRNWLVYVGGRPGMGKSAFVVQEAMHAARLGIPTYIASVEMTRAQILDRMIGTLGGPGVEDIQRGGMSSDQWSAYHEAGSEIAQLPIWIDDEPQGVDSLTVRVRDMVETHGVGLVVVDYVQLLRGPATLRRGASDFERCSAISNGLAALKRSLPVTILAAAQLRRDGAVGIPSLADLKGSGDFEQDADLVLFPFREGYGKQGGDQSRAQIIAAKCRHGRTGSIPASWEGARTRYVEVAQDARVSHGAVAAWDDE